MVGEAGHTRTSIKGDEGGSGREGVDDDVESCRVVSVVVMESSERDVRILRNK